MANSRKWGRGGDLVFVLKRPNHSAIQPPTRTCKNLAKPAPTPLQHQAPFIKPYSSLLHHKQIRFKAIVQGPKLGNILQIKLILSNT